jgi:hypothetical protein
MSAIDLNEVDLEMVNSGRNPSQIYGSQSQRNRDQFENVEGAVLGGDDQS